MEGGAEFLPPPPPAPVVEDQKRSGLIRVKLIPEIKRKKQKFSLGAIMYCNNRKCN